MTTLLLVVGISLAVSFLCSILEAVLLSIPEAGEPALRHVFTLRDRCGPKVIQVFPVSCSR